MLNKNLIFHCLISTLLLASTSLRAADQIVVTASRTPLELSRVGNATTVIGYEEIERRQIRYVTDLLRSVPGFAVSRSGVEGTQTQVRVRGAEANHVLVMIDGVRANDPATDDGFRWEQLTTGNIERIEIVRGPQSALWGSDALAGVVNIVTRNGGAAGADGYIEGGSNRSYAAGLNGRSQFASWSFSGGMERIITDGENISRGSGERDGSGTSTGSLGASYSNGEGATVDFRLHAVDAFVQTDAFTTQPVDANEATDSQSLAARLSGRLQTLQGKWGHRVSLDWFDSDNSFRQSSLETLNTRADRLKLAYQSEISLGNDTLVLAVEREQSDFRQRGQITFGDPNQDQELDTNSLVADFQGLTGSLSWLISLRYDDNSDFDNAATGRVALAYKYDAATTLRANLGTGRKNPTFNERFGFFPDQFLGNPDLQPEKSVAYELGVDRLSADGTFNTQLSLFYQNLRDEINGFAFDAGSGMFTAVNRAGTSRRSGMELSGTWTPDTQYRAGFTYTYLDAKQKDNGGTSVRETRTPRHSGGLWATYNSPADGFRITLSGDYGGSRTDMFFGTFPATTVKLNGYWLVNVLAEFRLKQELSFFIRGSNAFDADYEEVYGYNTPGRQFYAGLRWDFGD